MSITEQRESSFTCAMREFAETLKNKISVRPSVPSTISSPGSSNPDHKVVVHLMRHAQSEHNVAHIHGRKRTDYKDPELTDRGIKQCEKAMATFPYMDNITIILCSPLRRTLQTALLTFQPLYARGLKLILWSLLREWGNGLSNIGYTVPEMKIEMASLPVDLRLLNEGWELEKDPEEEGAERSDRVREDLFDLGEILLRGGTWKGVPMEKQNAPVHIMVVSHGGFTANVMFSEVLRNGAYKSLCFASPEQIAKGISKYHLFELPEKTA